MKPGSDNSRPLVTSRSKLRIKQVRALRQRKARQESRLFLVEGIRHVGEAVEAGAALEAIVYAPELLKSAYARSLIEAQEGLGLACLAVSPEVFESLADKDNPTGILAVVRQPDLRLVDFGPVQFRWGAALVSPQDPGNVGTILRTLDAVGADGLLLLDSGLELYHPSAVRASMGAIFWKRTVSATFAEFAAWSRHYGYHVVGTSAHGAVDYRAARDYQAPCILLLGSEREGLTAAQAELCERIVRLPMDGRATSLNLGVAAGVMLYEMHACLAAGS
jgi:RNA methyltransferase, TrmH family